MSGTPQKGIGRPGVQRGTCRRCGRLYAISVKGKVRKHERTSTGGLNRDIVVSIPCEGSGQEPA